MSGVDELHRGTTLSFRGPGLGRGLVHERSVGVLDDLGADHGLGSVVSN